VQGTAGTLHARKHHSPLTSLPPTRPFHQYLGDLDAIKADVAKVAAQASAKKA